MSKFLYRVDGGRYGGELAIGKVTAEFVRYWQDKDQDDLVSHIVGLDWDDSEDVDTNSPDPYEDMDYWNNWYECDDYEHENGYYADCKFSVHDVSGNDPESEEAQGWDEDAVEVDPYHLMSRECYAQKEEPEDLEGYTPVLCFHSGEKGGFGQWFIETGLPAWHPPKKTGFFRHIVVRKSFYEDKLLLNLVTSSEDIEKFDSKAFSNFGFSIDCSLLISSTSIFSDLSNSKILEFRTIFFDREFPFFKKTSTI